MQEVDEDEPKLTAEIHSAVSMNLWPTLNEKQQKNYVLKNLKVMRLLGLFTRSSTNNGNSYLLSERGSKLKHAAIFKYTQFLDFIHYLMYCTYEWTLDVECAFSWTYQRICDLLWADRPKPISPGVRALIDRVLIASREQFEMAEEISLSKYAIDGVNNWIGNLEPPFVKIRSGRRYTTNGREFCSPELLILSIEATYRKRGLSFGSPLLLKEDAIEEVCRTALLSIQAFDQVLEVTLSTRPQILMHSGLWGRSLILDKSYLNEFIGV
ncbi:MAG: hypothetical protein ACXAEN_22595 [Candidatus Thorarchaeota archaeon]